MSKLMRAGIRSDKYWRRWFKSGKHRAANKREVMKELNNESEYFGKQGNAFRGTS